MKETAIARDIREMSAALGIPRAPTFDQWWSNKWTKPVTKRCDWGTAHEIWQAAQASARQEDAINLFNLTRKV